MNWKKIFILAIVLICCVQLSAQRDTGTRRTDTSAKRTDSSSRKRDTTKRVAPKPTITLPTPPQDSTTKDSTNSIDSLARDTIETEIKKQVKHSDTSTYYAYFRHPYLKFSGKPTYMVAKERTPESKDTIFYLLTGLLFFVAFTRLLFPKYFQNTFRLFFQTTFRQKQTRDQLLQQSLGSLLLNLLFFLSATFYLTLVLQYYKLTIFSFWQLFLYSSIALIVLYVGKFLFLSFAGWVFNVKEGARTYIFIVFLINKIIGVMLIPFILVIAFSETSIASAAIAASLILIGLLFFYRYFVSLKSFRRDLHINPFHFFLYLCGVEIVPLLVIGKIVFNYIDGRF